jgi:ribosomal protein S20
LAKTPRSWTGARTPSGLKRVRQAERRREILQPRRTAAKTLVAKAVRVATQPSDGQDPQAALIEALSALDRAAKAGAIHPNAAARRKSRLTIKINDALGGFAVQPSARAAKTTGKAQAAKAAKARIAASKADKAKGAQTAAGKARAALTKTTRTDAKAEAAASATRSTTKTARPTTKAATSGRASATSGRAKASTSVSKPKTARSTAKKTTKS